MFLVYAFAMGNKRTSAARQAAATSKGGKRPLWPLLLLAVVLWQAWGLLFPPPQPVSPEDTAGMDPEVFEILEDKLERAREDPRDGAAHATIGLVYEANKMWDEAQRSFANAVELEPGKSVYRLHWAVCLRQAGDVAGGLEQLKRLVADDPTMMAARQRLGRALLQAGDTEAAMVEYRVVIAMAKKRLEGYLGLGECLLRLDDFEGALEQLEKARDIDPEYGPTQYSLGMALRALGRREEAEVALAKGLQWEFSSTRYLPDELSRELSHYTVNFVGVIESAVEMINTGRAQEAVTVLNALHRSRPDDTTVMVNLAAAHIKLAQREKARSMLDKALKLKPTEFAIWLNLASCYNDMGRLPEAETHVDRAIELAPKVGRAHFIRALILIKSARLEEAYDALKTCVRLDTRKADAFDFLAELCIRLSLADEALGHFRTSVRIEPDNLVSQVSLGHLCVRAGLKQEAEAALAAAQRLNPDYASGADVADQKTQALAARITAMP